MGKMYKYNGERVTAEELAAKINANGGIKLTEDDFIKESDMILKAHPEKYYELNEALQNDSNIIINTIFGYEMKCAKTLNDDNKENYRMIISELTEKLNSIESKKTK